MSNFIEPDGNAMDVYDQFRRAELDFNLRDYRGAIARLNSLVADLDDASGQQHGLSTARELLARSYFHAAQLEPAEAVSRQLLAANPTDEYAALLLARTLQRQSRHEEADRAFRVAAALGAPEVDYLTSPSFDVHANADRTGS